MVPKVKRINDLRVDNDLTQKQMANILNITRSKYSQIEIGILDFDLQLLNKFANYFKINIDYIYGLTDKKEEYYKQKINEKTVGNNLKNIRKQLHLSQEQLCKKANIKQSSYSRYEQGKGITAYKIYVIAKTLNISVDKILDRKPITLNKN